MSPTTEGTPAKKTTISLTPGSVSVGGENSLALELDEGTKEEKGRIRLVPLNAVMAIDILQAAKAEEEKRADPVSVAGYFR
jgi:hypothetical protein